MKKLLVGLLALSSVSAFAYVKGNGKVSVSSGFYAAADQSLGVNITIKGKAASVLFEEINFSDIRGPGGLSNQEIRQNDTIQCVKYGKKEIECRVLLNSDGTQATMPRLRLNH